MKAFLGEIERRQLKYRTKKVMEYLKENRKVAGHVPFGYRRVGDELVEVPEEQEIIRIANEIYAKTGKLKPVVEFLNSNRYRTRNGKPWTYEQVKCLIKGYKPRRQKKRSEIADIIKAFVLSLD